METGETKGLRDIWMHIKSFRRKLKPELNKEERQILEEFIEAEKQNNNYILQLGDIEMYFPEYLKNKDINNVIKLLSNEQYENWKASDKYNSLLNIVMEIVHR